MKFYTFLYWYLKYMSYQDLHYLILKLLTRNFGFSRYNMALWVKTLGLEDKVSMHSFLLRIYKFTLYQPSEGQRKVPFVCRFWFFTKRIEKFKKIGLMNILITMGPLFSSHPLHALTTLKLLHDAWLLHQFPIDAFEMNVGEQKECDKFHLTH